MNTKLQRFKRIFLGNILSLAYTLGVACSILVMIFALSIVLVWLGVWSVPIGIVLITAAFSFLEVYYYDE